MTFDVHVSEIDMRTKLRDKFYEKKDVKDVRVIDLLVLKVSYFLFIFKSYLLRIDIQFSINTVYRKCNEVRLDFSILNGDIKSIKYVYMYRYSLWNVGSNYVESFYTAWWKAIQAIWKLPFSPQCNILHGINNILPIDVRLERRCINYAFAETLEMFLF